MNDRDEALQSRPRSDPAGGAETAAAGSPATLGELYHSTPYADGFPYDEWMHIGTRGAALERARSIHPEDFGLPGDTPAYLHAVRLRGRVYPRTLTDDQATSMTGDAYPIRDVDEGMPPGLGYTIFPYRNDGEDEGNTSYLVHRTAIVPLRQETIQRNELPGQAQGGQEWGEPSMTGLDDFWAGYAATLARVRDERPSTVDGVAAILNDFQPASAGVAFFGNNADDRLSDALADAGGELRFLEQDYLWEARHSGTGEWLHYVEGDVYPGPERKNPAQPPRETVSSAEPSDKTRAVPGDVPAPKVSKAAARAAEVKAEAARYGLTVTAKLSHDFNPVTREQDGKVIDATVTVEGTFPPGDARAYIAAEANANSVLGMIRMVRPGSVWGTDSASVGGHAGMTGGYVRMNKSGAEIAVARHLAQAGPPAGGSNPAAPRGNEKTRIAAAASPAARFPYPPRPAAPETGSARTRKPATPRPGQQVPPRARGRSQ